MKLLHFTLYFLLITPTYSQSRNSTHNPNTIAATNALPRPGLTTRTRFWTRYPLPAADLSRHSVPQTYLHFCKTSRDSPTYDDVLEATSLLKKLGNTRCEQRAPAFATCTIMMTYESAGIMICGLKGVRVKCREAGKMAEGLMEVCRRSIGGVDKVGGMTYINPEEPRDKTRVVVFNNWDGFE
ncbi:hypothetical protein Q9L58_007258 [Maublancomyces gigas]|uniref:Uncharacterized protein n=1 Tax=Discina gigas TaxID=1032678 RepID=A0ABR3GDB7_9PEZI